MFCQICDDLRHQAIHHLASSECNIVQYIDSQIPKADIDASRVIALHNASSNSLHASKQHREFLFLSKMLFDMEKTSREACMLLDKLNQQKHNLDQFMLSVHFLQSSAKSSSSINCSALSGYSTDKEESFVPA